MHAAAMARAIDCWEIRKLLSAVPASLIEDKDCVCAGGDFGGDLVEMKLHGFGVAERQNEGSAGSIFRAYRTE